VTSAGHPSLPHVVPNPSCDDIPIRHAARESQHLYLALKTNVEIPRLRFAPRRMVSGVPAKYSEYHEETLWGGNDGRKLRVGPNPSCCA
jgi:hypothetical protein